MVALLLCSACWSGLALAAPPKLTRLSVRGFQAGGVTRIRLTGTDLAESPQLILLAPIRQQKLIGQAQATTVEFEVTLDAAVPAGLDLLRVRTAGGISSPELVTIDALPQADIATAPPAAKSAPLAIPVAVHGSLTGATTAEIAFAGRKGAALTVDVLAQRFGSKLRPVVHLYDEQRRQLAWSLPQTALQGDARLSAQLPADGTYFVTVHDLTYAGGAPGHYRVAIGEFDYVDAVYPPCVAEGGSTAVELVGRIGSESALQLPATAAVAAWSGAHAGESRPLPWPAGAAPVGLRPFVQVSTSQELAEEQLAGQQGLLPSLPAAVCGRLQQPGEVDRYRLQLAAGQKVRFEVFADRLGSPLDLILELQSDKGARLQLVDDTAGPDPRLDYTAPAQPSTVQVVLSDALSRGQPSGIYRLVVSPLDTAAALPDFRLLLSDDTHNLPPDGSKVLRVEAQRTNYDGPIQLTISGLPPGFAADAVEIPAGSDGALVEIRRTAAAAADAQGAIAVRGEATQLKPPLIRTAESATQAAYRLQPWLKYDTAVAASAAAAPLNIAWVNQPTEAVPLYLGTDSKLEVELQSAANSAQPPSAADAPAKTPPAPKSGNIRLSLVTSQAGPSSQVPAAQAQAGQLRGLMPTVEIKPIMPPAAPPKPAATAAEPAQAETPPLPAGQKAEFALRTPLELKAAAYDVALRAELLSADGRTVLAEAYTSPRRLTAQPPLALEVDPTQTEPLVLDAKQGATWKVTGSLTRFAGFANEVTITLSGLPAGVTAPSQVLKPASDQFQLELKLPPSLAATELNSLHVVAAVATDMGRNAQGLKVTAPLPARTITKPEAAGPAKKPAAAPK